MIHAISSKIIDKDRALPRSEIFIPPCGEDSQVNAAAETEVWLLDMGGDVDQLFGCPGLSSLGVSGSDSDQDGALP